MKTLYFFIICTESLFAFKDHYDLTYKILKSNNNLSKNIITVQSLNDFLKDIDDNQDHKKELMKIFERTEEYMEKQKGYQPVPENLKLLLNEKLTKEKFCDAMRCNNALQWADYIRCADDASHKENFYEKVADLEKYEGGISHPTYSIKLENGEKVRALDIIATASDKPDNGYDQDLFASEDNNFNNRLGFGKQLSLKSESKFSSQAPFHMDFYHENKIIKKLGNFEVSYVKYRIYQYIQLSMFAFRTGHAYQGYDFLGRAIHYLQDMCQPYHVTPVPGTGTSGLIYASVCEHFCSHEQKEKLKNTSINGHSYFENLVFCKLQKEAQEDENFIAPLSHHENQEVDLEKDDWINEISGNAHNLSKALGKDLKIQFPEIESEANWEKIDHMKLENEYITPNFSSTVREILKNVAKCTRNITDKVLKFTIEEHHKQT